MCCECSLLLCMMHFCFRGSAAQKGQPTVDSFALYLRRLKFLAITYYYVVSFLVPPIIKGVNETSEVSVVLGFPSVLSCNAEGSPTPSITWLKDNLPLVSTPQLTYTNGGQALRLGSAQGDSSGLYTCRATNPAGTAIKHYSLSVLGKYLSNTTLGYNR